MKRLFWLGVGVATDDLGLRVTFPELTAERRTMLMKLAGEKLEQARVDFGAILDYASSFGTVALSRAYADWSDPAAVVYDAAAAAKARGRGVLLVDTAGRLHTRANLMAELDKIRRVAAREIEGAPHEVLLVVDGTTGANALNQALAEILAVNTVFASVSLPVSVNTQGTYLNDIYVGMFRPAQHFYPRWNGNLKQYKLGKINNQLKMLDADDAAAINTQTGFLTECALRAAGRSRCRW